MGSQLKVQKKAPHELIFVGTYTLPKTLGFELSQVPGVVFHSAAILYAVVPESRGYPDSRVSPLAFDAGRCA